VFYSINPSLFVFEPLFVYDIFVVYKSSDMNYCVIYIAFSPIDFVFFANFQICCHLMCQSHFSFYSLAKGVVFVKFLG